MTTTFHIHSSKIIRILNWIVIAALWTYAAIMLFQQKWDKALFAGLYSFIFVCLLYTQAKTVIRIQSLKRLFVSTFSIDIASIYLLEEQPNRKIKIHYLFDGQERSYALPVAHHEIDSFMDTMKQLNPAIQIHHTNQPK